MKARRWLGAVTLAAAACGIMLMLTAESGRARAFDPLEEEICIVAPPLAYDPGSGLPVFAPRPVPADARCPVCGMYPARAPRWAAQLIFRDGAAQFFDSPANLFIFTRHLSRYTRAYGEDDIAVAFVTDAEHGSWVDLREAHFVIGSDALGPMRDGNLPAFAQRAAAEDFAVSRGGRVISAADITDGELAEFDRGRHDKVH